MRVREKTDENERETGENGREMITRFRQMRTRERDENGREMIMTVGTPLGTPLGTHTFVSYLDRLGTAASKFASSLSGSFS